MKRYSLMTAGATLAILVGGMLVTNAQTSTTNPSVQNRNATQRDAQNRDSAQSAQRDSQNRDSALNQQGKNSKSKTVRASEVIGMDIYNPQGEDVAEVNDVVLDPDTGKVRYAAVTYGGILGIGDEMFAVPWEAFQCTQDPENPEEHRLTLDVTKSQLEGAQGFNQENWPDFADPNFTNQIDRRYRVSRKPDRDQSRTDGLNRNGLNTDRDRNVDVNVDRNGVDVGIDSNRQNREQ